MHEAPGSGGWLLLHEPPLSLHSKRGLLVAERYAVAGRCLRITDGLPYADDCSGRYSPALPNRFTRPGKTDRRVFDRSLGRDSSSAELMSGTPSRVTGYNYRSSFLVDLFQLEVSMRAYSTCPQCGCKFNGIGIWTIPQLALEMGVKTTTVQSWMRSGKLKFKLWARSGGSVKTVFRADDVAKFLNAKLSDPYRHDGSLASRLWDWRQRNGRRGGLASAAARRAKLKETKK